MSKARDLANAGTALTTVSATELGYVDGVTSAIQTQIDSKIGSASAINPTIVDAKGDIIAATAADTVARLAVGANDTVLTADSTQATGLKWATPSSGGMTLISETVASALSSLSYSSLGSYKQLLLVWSGIRHDSSGDVFNIRLNNNSGSVYFNNTWGVENSNVVTNRSTQTSITNYGGGVPFGMNATEGDLSADAQGSLLIDNYTSTTKYKTFFGTVTYKDVANTVNRFATFQGNFASTSAVTSIDIVRTSGSGTFTNSSNTSIRLYGLS